MAQTHHVAARRVGTRGAYDLNCRACGQPIQIGEPYKWFKQKQARGGIKKCYHPGCTIPPSHRTTSRMGTIWDAQADLSLDGCESLDDISTAMQEFAETVREVGNEYTESADNMESGFGHETEQSQEIRERGEGLETWAEELESWEFQGEVPEEDDFVTTGSDFSEAVKAWEDKEPQGVNFALTEDGEAEYDQAVADWNAEEPTESEYEIPDEEAYEAAVEEMLNEARSDAQSAADECPV